MGEGENTPRWIFVPTGLHLISSPALVKASLRHQNEYIESITAIPVEGITESMMKQGDANNESVENQLFQNCSGIESIERTSLLGSRGRWLLIVQKAQQDAIREYIMRNILSKHERTGMSSLPGVPVSFAGSLIGPTTVGNYAEVLRKNLTPTSIDLTTNTHNTGMKHRRRTQIPIYTSNSVSASKGTKTQSRKGDSTATATTHHSPNSISTISPTTTDYMDNLFKNKLATWETDMENNLNARFQQFENTQKEKFSQFEAKLNKTIDALLSSAAEKLKQSIQPQLEMMTNNMIQMQNKVMNHLHSIAFPTNLSLLPGNPAQIPHSPAFVTDIPPKRVQFSENHVPLIQEKMAHSSLGGKHK